MNSISYIIPSINRESLQRTIASIEMWPGDEICVEYDLPKSNQWGNPQRNKAIARAKGDYLAFIDDDDYYVPGYRQIMDDEIKAHPGLPLLFRMQYPNGGRTLWEDKRIYPGNVSTPQILVPNRKEMLVEWEGGRHMADFIFISNWKWNRGQEVWVDKVIVNLGHDDDYDRDKHRIRS